MPESAPEVYGLVYRATNSINGKIYIGITIQGLKQRVAQHISKSKNKPECIFHQALHKYGEAAFVFEIIEECFSEEDLLSREMFYINSYQSAIRSKGYNQTYGGEGGVHLSEETKQKLSAARLGSKLSEETKQKLSISSSGRKHSEASKQLMREVQAGHKVTEETKLAISASLKGRKASEETKQKQREAHIGKVGEKAPMYGKHHSFETRQRMSKSHTGLKQSPETTAKRLRNTKRVVYPVQKLDEYGRVLASYSSAKEAALECNLFLSGILNACAGRQKLCGGFVWRFKNEEDRLLRLEQNLGGIAGKAVVQLDKAGNILNEFSTMREASIKYDIVLSGIYRVCLGKRKSAAGFIWRFKNEADRYK